MNHKELNREVGNIDIYLLDQILKGRFDLCKKILDAGCGEGRNVHYFLKNNFEVYGIDKNPSAIRMARFVANSLKPDIDKNRFKKANIEQLPYSDAVFDAVICSAVLHFAQDISHLLKMWHELARVLKGNGILFVRMAAEFGLEEKITASNGQHILPDQSIRFLLKEEYFSALGIGSLYEPLEPIKSVIVHGQRTMTTLVLKKSKT